VHFIFLKHNPRGKGRMQLGHQRGLWWAVIPILAAGPAAAGTIEGRVQTNNPKLDLAGFVAYVDDVAGPFPHPDRVAIMDQKSLRFVPHVLPIQVGTTVEFANSDPLAHNVFSISRPKRFNLGLYGRGTSRRVRFDQPGVVQLLCNVHQEMSAFIVVVKSPYFARTATDGSFRIESVPAGRHRVRIWHEAMDERSFDVVVAAAGVTRKTISLN
jgi:plastocyanin